MIKKAAGLMPDIGSARRREIRQGLRAAGKIVREQIFAEQRQGMADAAKADLLAMGHVADLNGRDYRKAKKTLLRTLRQTEKKP